MRRGIHKYTISWKPIVSNEKTLNSQPFRFNFSLKWKILQRAPCLLDIFWIAPRGGHQYNQRYTRPSQYCPNIFPNRQRAVCVRYLAWSGRQWRHAPYQPRAGDWFQTNTLLRGATWPWIQPNTSRPPFWPFGYRYWPLRAEYSAKEKMIQLHMNTSFLTGFKTQYK